MPVPSNLPQWAIVALPLVILWDLAWRGLALWGAARRSQVAWFVFLMVLNTVGILPIIYLLLHRGATEERGD